jgi:threonine/homoserine/homoserine lactone efflux protein
LDLVWSFGRGFVIGFAIAAAVGPIGLLCIRRTLAEGRAIGAVSGLGAATADAFYASIAAFGLTALSDLLIGARRPLGILGGCFLVILAIHSLLRPAVAAGDRPPRTLLSAYATTVGLTIANPATILSFAAAFVGLGLAGHSATIAAALVLGGLLRIRGLVDRAGGCRVGFPEPPRAGRAASSGGVVWRPVRRS